CCRGRRRLSRHQSRDAAPPGRGGHGLHAAARARRAVAREREGGGRASLPGARTVSPDRARLAAGVSPPGEPAGARRLRSRARPEGGARRRRPQRSPRVTATTVRGFLTLVAVLAGGQWLRAHLGLTSVDAVRDAVETLGWRAPAAFLALVMLRQFVL